MTRKKVKLAFISNDPARKATFKKRKKGLLKKIDELTTLCGIEACAIVYSPYDAQPEVWPSQRGVQKVLTKFRNMPELEQSKKMVNQESFLKQRIQKAKEQVQKQRKDNREKEMTQLMFLYFGAGNILHNLTMLDLNDLSWLIDQNLRNINRMIETLNNNAPITQNQPQLEIPTTLADRVANNEEITVQGLEMNCDTIQKQQGFMDLMINGNGSDETMPFGDVNNQNCFWPNNNPLVP